MCFQSASSSTFFFDLSIYLSFYQSIHSLLPVSFVKVVYLLPQCASQSPASGDGNLLGKYLKTQELTNHEALKILAEGTDRFFPIFICDAGYQIFGNITHTEDNWKDFREVVADAGAIFLGKMHES